jgi:hypothetical protein
MATESGYSNQKKKGIAQFKTIHNVGSNSFGEAVASKYLYTIGTGDIGIDAVEEIFGSSGQVEFWKLTIPNHGGQVGGIVRMYFESSLPNFEFEIVSVVDVDNLLILPISESMPIGALDSCIIYNWVTGISDPQGNPQITINPSPTSFILDTNVVPVNEDTVTPANNVFLPVKDIVAQASLSSIDGKFTTLNAKDFATAAKQDTGNSSLSSIDGNLQANGVVDAGNSSVTPLGINGVFTGAAFDITRYAAINVNVISDVASATNGLKVEFSPDGTNWDHSHQTTYSGGNGVGYIFNAEFKFARVVYTNSTVAQTSFRLQTIFKTTLTTSSLYTLSQTVNANMFAALNRSVISGETTGGGGGYVNVKVNPSGALTVEADVTGTVSVSNFPATQPVSAAALPLPTGASTSALQTALNNKTAAGLVVSEHDEIVTTYVGATTRINTVVYKLATVTVATLTMSYDGSDRLVGVVRS